MIYTEQQQRKITLMHIAQLMMQAARTAPKARGLDNLEIKVIEGEDIIRLANKMREISQSSPRLGFFSRDASNIEQSEAIVLIGTKISSLGLDCDLCGYPSCSKREHNNSSTPCFFNSHDLGLAVGSAVTVASNHKADNRVMYSVGVGSMQLGIMPNSSVVSAIPLSCSGKNPFYDRK